MTVGCPARFPLLVALFVVTLAVCQTELSRAANLRVLASFCSYGDTNCALGQLPTGGVILDPRGNLFGTAEAGGVNGGEGTVFEIPKIGNGYSTTPTILYTFCQVKSPLCADGDGPAGTLLEDAGGDLFGTTETGGDTFQGTIFELAKSQTGYVLAKSDSSYDFRRLYSFCANEGCADGAVPTAGLVADRHGNLYGTTTSQGFIDVRHPPPSIGGSAFVLRKGADGHYADSVLAYPFCTLSGCPATGGPGGDASVDSGLAIAASGTIFGATDSFSASSSGTVFELRKSDLRLMNAPLTLHSFCEGVGGCGDGALPNGSLLVDRKGNLFGTTTVGGPGSAVSYSGDAALNGGTLYELTRNGRGFGAFSPLYSFCDQPGCADGDHPSGGLIMDADGDLFGVTIHGGANSAVGGTVFELAKTSDGYAHAITTLYSFCAQPNCADGAWPMSGLFADPAGNLFGITQMGGVNNSGTVFELTDAGFASWFTGRPGDDRCTADTTSELVDRFGDLDAAALVLRYSDGSALEEAIATYCTGGSSP